MGPSCPPRAGRCIEPPCAGVDSRGFSVIAIAHASPAAASRWAFRCVRVTREPVGSSDYAAIVARGRPRSRSSPLPALQLRRVGQFEPEPLSSPAPRPDADEELHASYLEGKTLGRGQARRRTASAEAAGACASSRQFSSGCVWRITRERSCSRSHPRQVVVLGPGDWARWLNGPEPMALLRPSSAGGLQIAQVA